MPYQRKTVKRVRRRGVKTSNLLRQLNKVMDRRLEHKYIDKTFNVQQVGPVSTATIPSYAFSPNNQISQGANNSQRLGHKIKVTGVQLRMLGGLTSPFGTPDFGTDVMRVMIGYSENPVYGNQTTIAGLAGAIEGNDNLIGTANPSPYGRIFVKDVSDIVWLYDQVHGCNMVTNQFNGLTDTSTIERTFFLEKNIKFKRSIVYDTSNTTSASSVKGSLIFYVCNAIDYGVAGVSSFINGNIRWTFVDA